MTKLTALILAFLALASSAFAQNISVGVTWDTYTDPVASFKLYEKTGPATVPVYTLVATIPAASGKYTMVNYQGSADRTFVITAANSQGLESIYSNELVVEKRPLNPKGFRVEFVIKVTGP